MSAFITAFFQQVYALLPFFILMGTGYFLVRVRKWPKEFTRGLTRFLFNLAIPIMLFGVMSRFHTQQEVDPKLILAYFGGSFILYFIAMIVSRKFLKLNAKEASVFGIGGIFSNNVMVGIPIIMLFMGDDAIAVSALIITFNALLLWSLVSFSIEWVEHGSFSLGGIIATTKGVLRNPVVIGIMLGLLVSYFRVPMPDFMGRTITMFSNMVAPLSLLSIGMGLAEYRLGAKLKIGIGITIFKLILHPLIIWLCALALGLPAFETKAIVLLGSIAVGMNVYLMAIKFEVIEDAVASSIVLTTIFSAITTPIILLLMA
ncbi:hypothetical protein B9T11_06145 [Wohlfahrtiimonas chitiniclastica]|uniref:AEC family transporter n=1 Tax=Wohlfahrtiimonas chitiniclastica TaxID=400946 RepID=A0AB35C0K0_9GAMM|nr:AEC family transporter [Wohlfahrtiimonas chitiniclastica]MBS7815212.1 AEC family transporter [Wohlfahrtiimonas chitiniclastica]MBS7817369.1 AEC family transporter [Wohlfahrtiimonas chitiniclastica]MBS7819233.1 AEC family transporter [Wohlfahrtiimonas chitiniclastica]MBS7820985.1 AEC family transporter [Wohlfahrtiimonas chitiniclastica]MBS7823057.1 AEC family transporter [Wohlfahrtiimonas chitiniclastica]